MKVLIRIFWLFGLMLTGACSSTMQVEKTVTKKSEKPIISMVSLNPDFEIITSSANSTPREYKSINKQEIFFKDALLENATKNGLRLKILNANNFDNQDANYFKELAPLKREIMRASYLQDFITNDGEVTPKDKQGIGEFERGPIIASHYSYLAKKHETPYFAVQGLTSHKKPREEKYLLLFAFPPLGIASFFYPEVDTYFYNIVADVESSKIVYKEIRKVNQLANKSNMNAIIFDSFRIMKGK